MGQHAVAKQHPRATPSCMQGAAGRAGSQRPWTRKRAGTMPECQSSGHPTSDCVLFQEAVRKESLHTVPFY